MPPRVECKIVEEIDTLGLRKLQMTYAKLTGKDASENIKVLLGLADIKVDKVVTTGRGSYSIVYKAKYKHSILPFSKDKDVAIKVIKIDQTQDRLEDLSIEAELLSKAYNYSPYDNSHTVPEIYKCIFFCDKARNCNGIQIIIMELGIPFDVILKDDILSLKYKVDKINRILIHYKTLVMKAGIYMFDVKPKNATISTKDGSPNIIDFGYKHVF